MESATTAFVERDASTRNSCTGMSAIDLSPEEYLSRAARAIAQATKRGVGAMGRFLKQQAQTMRKRVEESAEMERRLQTQKQTRFDREWFLLKALT